VESKQLVGLIDASKYDTLAEAVEEVLELIHFDFKKKMRKIAIKPNLCNYWASSTGETTDPKVVEAVVDVLRTRGSPDEVYLVESDATVMKAKYAFRVLGYEELAQKKDLRLLNLCKDNLLPAEADANISAFNQIRVPKTLTEADLFVSVPKLKLHSLVGFSCALKNQFGCIPVRKKIDFHKNIHSVIALINKLITPDLVLVDGIISRGKTSKRLNLLLAGYDPVAVDFIAAKIAGLSPKRIKYIVESKNMGVGSTDVECRGDNWLQFANSFPRRGFLYNFSRRSLQRLYYLYLRLFTLEGRIFKSSPQEMV